MQFIQIDSEYYCGIDLHARSLFVTVMDKLGTVKLRQYEERF